MTRARYSGRFPRRDLLRLGGGIAAGSAAAVLLGGCGDGSKPSSKPGALKPVKLGWWGATCEAPLYTAYDKGFFAREGLRVELVNLGQAAAKDAIASGKVDGAPGITFEWLKPIEQGADIRVTGGLHGGCLRLVAGAKTGITTLQQLKGKTVGTDQIGGSAHSFFTVVLSAAGIDPKQDVQFVAYPGAQLETAIGKGEVVAVAAADPFPYLIVSAGKGVELASNLTGTYQDHFCCAIGLNGKLTRDEPATAAAVTRAWLSAAKWVGANADEVGRIEADKKYVPIDAEVSAKLLKTYTWEPSVTKLQDNITRYAQEFAKTGILEKGTDPKKLADTVFFDVTGGDKGIDSATPTLAPSAPSAPPVSAGSGHGHSAEPSHSGASHGGATSSSGTAAGSAAERARTDGRYQLTAAQRQQLLDHVCHFERSGRVA